MKYLITILAILFTVSLNAQWSFNSTSGTGIQSPTNTASGDFSTAMGLNTTASGYYSTAMGEGTTASGSKSTAMGWRTTASGGYSTAMGRKTIAEGYGTFSIGHYNIEDSSPSPTTFDLSNTAFVIGNGADEDNRSDAMKVLFNGTTTIAGSVTAASFNNPNSQATGNNATAFGEDNTASGDRSFAAGYFNEALGHDSVAMGVYTEASGHNSFAFGDSSKSIGSDSAAIGNATESSGYCSIATGYGTTAGNDYSTSFGYATTASGNRSTAMGSNTSASGYASTSMGYDTLAEDFGTLSIGHFNANETTANPTSFDLANTAFVIGNGQDDANRSDALKILFDGTTTIAGDLTINSDARLKSNIISLGSTLNKLLMLDGKSYTLKKDESKQKIGLIAQDVQEVYPELVTEAQDEQGTLSVNYQGLIPVLINAIKEQQKEIDELKTEVNKLRNQ